MRDALSRQHQDWLSLIESELRHAAEAGDIADLDAEVAAFQIAAVLMAANTALRLGDQAAVTKVRRVIDGLLAPSRCPGRRLTAGIPEQPLRRGG